MFRTQLKMFILWKNEFPNIVAKERKQKYLQQSFFLKKTLRTWHKQLEEKRNLQKNLIKSEVIYKIILTKRFFQKLQIFKDYHKRARLFQKFIYDRKKSNLVKGCLKKWQNSFQINKNKKMIEKEKYSSILQRCFRILKVNYVTKKMRKIHLMALEKYLMQKTRRKMFLCLDKWNILIRKKKRSQNV